MTKKFLNAKFECSISFPNAPVISWTFLDHFMKKVGNLSELHSERRNFLQNPHLNQKHFFFQQGRTTIPRFEATKPRPPNPHGRPARRRKGGQN